jgi:hypothetical protein
MKELVIEEIIRLLSAGIIYSIHEWLGDVLHFIVFQRKEDSQ